jgi:uncharacterized protein (DUF1697 family)
MGLRGDFRRWQILFRGVDRNSTIRSSLQLMHRIPKGPEARTTMPTYVALLRGVNVGGNLLKMERLREICSEMGHRNVRTYVQSGNVVFEAAGSVSQCATALEKALSGETRLPVTVLLRTRDEIASILAHNPFLKNKGVDLTKLHVTFLRSAATKDGLKKLTALKAGDDEFRAAGTEIYLHCPNGYGRTKLSNNAIEKALALRATTRNWNTMNRLYEMAAG